MKFFKSTKDVSKEELLKTAKENLAEWNLNSEDKSELISDEEILLNFSQIIGFGTAGLRGKMKAGPFNMNKETVALATKALAELVLECKGEEKGVVIACDSRNNSEEFSKLSASVLAASGIKAYIFDSLRPTPELSFAIRYLGCIAGINVTASHNTKEYNGYKVYWEDGALLPPTEAKKVADKIYEIDIWSIKTLDFDECVKSGKIEIIGEEVDKKYLENVLAQSSYPEDADKLSVLYTPLHGAGYRLVPMALDLAGFKDVKTVKSQIVPDGNFPTVEKPNPQFISAFDEAIKCADGRDLIIATDPDADRMGVALKDKNGEFKTLSGNQIALVLIDYIIKSRKGNLPKNPAVVKSIVSSKLANVICEKNGIKVFDVYTGFKYIGEKIKEFEEKNDYSFLFGFEESYGYLVGTYARDKDGVVASLLIAEAALYYKKMGKTLFDALDSIYKEYGFWGEYAGECIIKDPDYLNFMASLMKKLRTSPPSEIGSLKLTKITDYESATEKDLVSGKVTSLDYASENVLTFTLEDNSSITVRPSGTEPKIKLYYFISSESKEESLEKLDRISAFFNF